MDRTIIHFENRITGVVGPNGCGKSNIVDAILWVMGEQSAKHLRGESMTDVIFNGSENRAPTSMAEVSLVLDKQGVMLAPPYSQFDKSDEISITRRIYRDGRGEYLINKQVCRLKDIHELFMDTGVGRRAYSIIEQGQIDRMINVKPEERLHLFEEVAGITKYKAKKKEAEKKLEATQQNLLRLQDIISELEKQMRSLKIQATRAKKYREIKSELETIDLHLLGRRLHILEKDLMALSSQREALICQRAEIDAQIGSLDAQGTEAELKKVDLEKRHQVSSDEERELAIVSEKLEGTLSLCAERKNFIEQNSRQISAEMTELDRDLRLLEEEIVRIDQELADQKAAHASEMEYVQALESRKQTIHATYVKTMEERSRLEVCLRDLTQTVQSLQAQIYHSGEREAELKAAQTLFNQKLSDLVVGLQSVRSRMDETERRIEAVSQRHLAAESDVARVASDCQDTSARVAQTENDLFEQRELYHRRYSRLQSLEELSQNLEGYLPTAREIRNIPQGTTAIPLAELVQPESAFEEHLEHILGHDMNTLVVKHVEEAERLALHIQQTGMERVGVIAYEGSGSLVTESGVEGAVPLLSKVRIISGYEAVAKRYLGHVYLCAEGDDAFALRRAYPGRTFVTANARLVARADGSMTCGSLTQSTGIFARRREIEMLQSECAQLKTHVDDLTDQHQRLLNQLKSQEREHDELKDRLSSIYIERIELRKEKENIQIELVRTDKDYQDVLRDTENNRSLLESIRSNLDAWREKNVRLVTEMGTMNQEASSLISAIERHQHELEGTARGLEEKRVSMSALGERIHALEFQCQKSKAEQERALHRSESLRNQLEREGTERSAIDLEERQTSLLKTDKNHARGQILELMGLLKTQFDESCREIQEIRERKETISRARMDAQSEQQTIELRLQQNQSDKDRLLSIASERYQRRPSPISEYIIIPLERIPLLSDQLSMDWLSMDQADRERLLEEHMTNLRQKIERHGEVNLTAIQEFEEIEGRFGFLNQQKEDLDRAVAVLQEAIIKIDGTTKVRFEETFHIVNSKFKEIFPILFNGGKAELSLIPSIDGHPGIDVMVQPPGKRLQSMSLLSGGEKALTAVSLILSIFARKPSPFCLLDEVDAPLDDANVSRFNTVIRKMSQRTQFIVITHNKKTMEMAEALYGVTMELAGVSKMTSVRLN